MEGYLGGNSEDSTWVLVNQGNQDHFSIDETILSWLAASEEVQFISDCSSYDWVLFCQLFKGALNLPSNFSPYCHDLNQDIAQYFDKSDRQAFDLSREEIAFAGNENESELARVKLVMPFGYSANLSYLSVSQHNALWDAYLIKLCYDCIHTSVSLV